MFRYTYAICRRKKIGTWISVIRTTVIRQNESNTKNTKAITSVSLITYFLKAALGLRAHY